MVGCSRIPGSHGTAAWQSKNVQRPIWTWCKHGHLIQHITSARPWVIVSGLYLRSKHLRSGSGSTVVEVVVHGSPREVVVHGDGSGTRFCKCSGSSVEVLDVHGVDARVTHVVGVLVVPGLASVDVHGNRSGTWRFRVVELDDPRGTWRITG